MHNVTPPALDDEQVFDAIAAAKRKPTKSHLRSVRGPVLEAYQAYAAVAPRVEQVAAVTVSDDERKALIHAYEVPTRPMVNLRAMLLDRVDAARCPFCGISQSATLDHYLPKEDYPAFSVYSLNLVPCCGHCNTLKQRLAVDESANVRKFLHPYFDPMPGVRFLRLAITISPAAIVLTYNVERPAGLPKQVYLQIQSHFRLLGLADRYRLMSLDELRGRYRALLQVYGPTEDAERVKRLLANESESLAAVYGANHWRVVLYVALSEHDLFCDGGFKVMGKPG